MIISGYFIISKAGFLKVCKVEDFIFVFRAATFFKKLALKCIHTHMLRVFFREIDAFRALTSSFKCYDNFAFYLAFHKKRRQ